MTSEIRIGDRVRLTPEASRKLPYWARHLVSGILFALEVESGKIGAFTSHTKADGIRGEAKDFEKVE